MKLLAKFLYCLCLCRVPGLRPGYLAYHFLENRVKAEVLQQARLILQSAFAMRDYTSEEIAPLLDTPAMRKSRFLWPILSPTLRGIADYQPISVAER